MLTHIPVLFSDILTHLQLKSNENVIDATLGGGGHARGLLDAIAPAGRLLGIEADERTLDQTISDLAGYGDRFIPIQGNFRNLSALRLKNNFHQVRGILIDLGLSSMALADPQRGFSFQSDGPLDMRFDQSAQTLTAATIVNTWSRSALVKIFQAYGEEPLAEKISDHLITRRSVQPFLTTSALAESVAVVKHRRGPRHPATQVFQALRIAVNDELGALADVLPQALDSLESGHRLAVITFHSLEDRLVKTWSKEAARSGRLKLVNKHVIVPTRAEQLANPRARSAKLRLVEKI